MADNARLVTEFDRGVVVATMRLEKITEFDVAALQSDLTLAARPHGFRLAIDMSQVLLMGSCGISLLLLLRKEAEASKGKLALFGLSDDLAGMLKITRLLPLFTICKERSAAVEACA